MVEILPFNTGGAGLIAGLGVKIPHPTSHRQKKKNQSINNRSNIVTNSIKALKMVHIKKHAYSYKRPTCCPDD